jgi:hydroxymethylbilane synthase
MKIRIGTRGSPLALAQAREVGRKLVAHGGMAPDALEIVVITTTGDRIRDRPLSDIGGKGLFTKELEEALFEGQIDLAVHSMKDMPARLPSRLDLAAVLEREDPRDAFLSPHATSLSQLPQNAILGSSSVRRSAQALRLRPDLQVVQMRGNVDTRLRKLSDGIAHATFLACAGLNRLGLQDRITAAISIDQMLPAVAQGAIAIEIMADNTKVRSLLQSLEHKPSAVAVSCERAFLAELDGSCRTPIAGHAVIKNNRVYFRGEALTPDGKHVFQAQREGLVSEAEQLGLDAAREVKRNGGSLIAMP